jgi:hypothetical protein
MIDFLKLILGTLALRLRSRASLIAEVLVLRHQVNVLRRQTAKRLQLSITDRFLLVWLYRLFLSVLRSIFHHQARNRRALASARVSRVLAVAVKAAGRQAANFD